MNSYDFIITILLQEWSFQGFMTIAAAFKAEVCLGKKVSTEPYCFQGHSQ